jgi:hypothetical protein
LRYSSVTTEIEQARQPTAIVLISINNTATTERSSYGLQSVQEISYVLTDDENAVTLSCEAVADS